MTKNPFINALAALAYIGLVVSVMTYGMRHAPPKDSVLAPVAFLSLFTLSAAMMGYLLLSQPLRLYIDGEKKRAMDLLLHTLAVFAGITLIVFIAVFSGIFS